MTTNTTTFNVRYYECDPHGHLGAANYLRYMQQAAFDAHLAAGYSRQRLAELGYSILISQSRLKFKRPLFFRDQVQVSTRADAFRRVSYQRGYQFTLPDGAISTTADSEWVLVDAQTGMPAEIPAEMAAALAVGGGEPVREKFSPIDPLPQPPEKLITFDKEVVWRDVTESQHMDNAVYLEFFTEAVMRVSENYGWTSTRFLDAGLGWFARDFEIAYHIPLHLKDRVEITAWLSEVRASSVRRHFRMLKKDTGELVSHASMRLSMVDLATNRPLRIPEQIMVDFAENIRLQD